MSIVFPFLLDTITYSLILELSANLEIKGAGIFTIPITYIYPIISSVENTSNSSSAEPERTKSESPVG